MLKIKGISKTEKPLLVYDKINKNTFCCCFRNLATNEIITKNMLAKNVQKMINNPVSSKAIMIKYDNKKETMIEFYEKIEKCAYELYEKSNKDINMFITGGFSKTALHFYFTKYFYKLDIILEDISFKEAKWIDNASKGALLIAKKYKEKAYSYDFVSFYPSIMKNPKMLFPIKAGIWKTLTQKQFNKLSFFQYGIFKAIINKHDDKNINLLFKFNVKNYYTHTDLNLAKKLNLTINLIENEPNFLYYERTSLVSGKLLFGEYINYLFELKKQKVSGAKNLITASWGKLCERNTFEIIFNIEDELEIFENKKILDLNQYSETKLIATICNKDKYFEYNFARMKPFLLAKGRFILSNTIKLYLNKIIYAHTDSMIVTEKLNTKTSDNIGDLKYEGYCEDFWCENITKKSPKSKFIE